MCQPTNSGETIENIIEYVREMMYTHLVVDRVKVLQEELDSEAEEIMHTSTSEGDGAGDGSKDIGDKNYNDVPRVDVIEEAKDDLSLHSDPRPGG